MKIVESGPAPGLVDEHTCTRGPAAPAEIRGTCPRVDRVDRGETSGAQPRVTLYTRVGCHLCDDARAAVARVTGELGVGWREVDIDTSPELVDAYGDRIPVVLVDGREHGYWRVEEARLRRDLTVGRWPWRARRPAAGRPSQDHHPS